MASHWRSLQALHSDCFSIRSQENQQPIASIHRSPLSSFWRRFHSCWWGKSWSRRTCWSRLKRRDCHLLFRRCSSHCSLPSGTSRPMASIRCNYCWHWRRFVWSWTFYGNDLAPCGYLGSVIFFTTWSACCRWRLSKNQEYTKRLKRSCHLSFFTHFC